MSGRTRNRSHLYDCGTRDEIQSGTTLTHNTYSFKLWDETCIDVVGLPKIDHSFNLVLYDVSNMEPIEGVRSSGVYSGSGYRNHYPDWMTLAAKFIDITADSVTNGDFDTLKARTNPSRPEVTPLTLIQDLVDIPRQLKDVGKLLKSPRRLLNAKEIANQNLGVQFGWLPLIQDVKDLTNLQHSIAKRIEEVHRLNEKEGLKRRIRLSDNSRSQSVSHLQVAGSIAAGSAFVDIERYQQTTKWGTIRWKPTVLPPYGPMDIYKIQQIKRIVAGLSVEGLLQGAWDVIPWTWLTDWFVDIGSFMGQYSNSIPAAPSHMCVMRHTRSISEIKRNPSTSTWIDGGFGSVLAEQKTRTVGAAPMTASIPFVGIQRLSILGSLFVQRFK